MSWLSSAFHSVEHAVSGAVHDVEHVAGDVVGGVEQAIGDASSILAGVNPLIEMEQTLLSALTGNDNSQDNSGFGAIGGILKDVAPIAQAVCGFL